jgi:tetratricopeptide (TPR) repeat protein
MRERNLLLTVWLLLACVSFARVAYAEDGSATHSDDVKREASGHFTRGAQLFQEGLYRAALVELQRAYDIAPNYRVLYNIAQTLQALGRFVEATAAYESYLAQGGSAIDQGRRQGVHQEIASLAKRIATLQIEVEREGVQVFLDEREIGTTPLAGPVRVNVGEHRIDATASDGATGTAVVEVAGGDEKLVRITLRAPAVSAAASAPTVGTTAPQRTPMPQRMKWGVGLLSAGGALAVAGGALAFVARAKQRDHDRALEEAPGNPSAIDDAHASLSRVSIVTDALLGTGLVLGVTGAVLLVMGHKERRTRTNEAQLGLRLTPRAVVAEGRF